MSGQQCDYESGTGIARGIISGLEDSFFIIGKNIEERFGKILNLPENKTIIIEDGENAKSMESYSMVITWLMENGAQRDSTLSYIGGGTVGDLAGFVASTFKRGMKLIAFPSTFLSMIDSSLGGKNGINLKGVKNMAGTFMNPSKIVADTQFILGNDSLIKNGLPEAIKHGLIGDKWIIERLEPENFNSPDFLEEFILHNAKIKAEICSRDPFDTVGIRNVLNFGHTVGHWIESVSGNSIGHGDAVMIGMCLETSATNILGFTEKSVPEAIMTLGGKLGISTHLPDSIKTEDFSSMGYDKKIKGNSIFLPVVTRMAESKLMELNFATFKNAVLLAMEE